MRACWDATSTERVRFFAFVIIFVFAYSADLLQAVAIAYVIDSLQRYGYVGGWDAAMHGVAAYMALRLTHTVLHHYARYMQNTVAYAARMQILNKIFGAVIGFPLNWHARHHSGDNLSKLHRSIGAIDSCVGTYIWQIIEGLVKVVFASLAIFALDFWVAVNVVSMALITILVMIFFNKRLTASYRKNNTFGNKINRICIDYFFNIVTVKTLRIEHTARKYLAMQRPEGLSYSREISKFSELKWGTIAVGYGIVIGSSLVIYLYGQHHNGLPFEAGKVWILLSFLDKIFQAIGSFTGYYGGLVEAAIAYEDGQAIIDESENQASQEGLCPVRRDWATISLSKLNFSYSPGERLNLRQMALDISRNDKIALVGPSGGGKSTLLKIVGGLLIPESCTTAAIAVDGTRQEGLSLADVAKLSLLVPQEPEIFSETLRYNLTMGEQFEQREIEQFLELGRLRGVLEKLPKGMETDMAEKGLNLSVGEKQRVAMVRGLLRARERDILLLDEPTSSLDPRTEKEIFLALLNHFSDRVIITACHRLNLVPLFDKIVHIADGQVIEIGGFVELLNRQGAFASAWEDYLKKVPKDDDL